MTNDLPNALDELKAINAQKKMALTPERVANLVAGMFADIRVLQFSYFPSAPPQFGDFSPEAFKTEMLDITAADLIRALQYRDAEIAELKGSNYQLHQAWAAADQSKAHAKPRRVKPKRAKAPDLPRLRLDLD